MWRHLIELISVDDAEFFKITKRICQHRICDVWIGFLQLTESHGISFAEFIDDVGAPFSAEDFKCSSHRAVIILFIYSSAVMSFLKITSGTSKCNAGKET